MTLNLVLRYKKEGDVGRVTAPVKGIGEHVMTSVRLIRAAGLKVNNKLGVVADVFSVVGCFHSVLFPNRMLLSC